MKEIRYNIGNIHEIYNVYQVNMQYIQPESEKHICRYCGKTGKNNFKSRAHLIPEFTGSKDLFAYNECKDCNNKFGIYENSLKNFGVKNIYIPIKGKGGYKKHKDFPKNTVTHFKDEKTMVVTANGDYQENEVVNGKMKFSATSYPFVPLYVYKAIAKIALSMLKTEDVKYFETLLNWINDPNMQIDSTIPLTLIINDEAKPPIVRPLAMLLKKKIEYNSPEFTFLFSWGFYDFQIFLPFNKNDEDLDYNCFYLPIRPDFVRQLENGEIRFEHRNMNSLESFKTELNTSVGFTPSKEYIERYGDIK